MKKPRPENAIDYSQFAFAKGTTRLSGRELENLRLSCLQRDKGKCQECGAKVSDQLPAWHPLKYHMAHIRSRGAGGADELTNIRTLCGDCHREEHAGQLQGATA
jgi:5-methylcytosine-specific restriction endonuclease McrA